MQKGYLTRQRAFASVYKRAAKATEASEETLLLWDGAFVDRQGLRDWLMPLLHEKINNQREVF
jgi:hypothetical protein